MYNEFFNQFIAIAIIHILAVMSPGPDFFLILKQSLSQGRLISLVTSIGIGSGIIVHIIMCVFGLGLIISNSQTIFNVIKIIGSLYIIYLGYQSIWSSSIAKTKNINIKSNRDNLFQAYIKGFLTNVLNPKATLFFLSLYTVILSKNPPMYIQLLYGLWMAIITGIWFCLISILLTNKKMESRIKNFGNKIQKIMGIILLIVGIEMLVDIFI
tara:strand:- start:746 stop:1381 length:636 start_codon:yes stop_codon:yes gene_type:complete